MTTGTEAAELRASITALEAQRSILGDAVVEPALLALREKLATLEAPVAAESQRKMATILFADVSGFTAMAETMDAELVAEVMNGLWALIDRAITDHGGRVDKHIGDGVMALWGTEVAREDDPERAIRAALAMQSAVDAYRATHHTPLAIRIGINTGPVLLGQMGSTQEFTAMGDAVNLASRLETAAPVGDVLISHDTYRHVRGIFDVLPQALLTVKGKTEPVQTYVVQQAKPRAFRLHTRGVEGVETRMIGRDAELLTLQDAYADAIEAGETRVVTVVGEAGVGKSRLLYEFDNWLELRPEMVTYFKGRATPNLQNVSLSLIRDLFAFRFNILDGDSAAMALEKFRAGMAGYLEPAQADVIGHWLGFDFSASEAVRLLLGSPDFGPTARAHLARYFRALVSEGPLAIFLEDIHWADDESLDLITYLVADMPARHLLFVAITRPTLFERRPSWGQGEAAFRQMPLAPLSKRASLALVEEILRHVDEVPDVLRELIISAAEGNPFYVEELIKMFIDQGVIVRSETLETEFPGRNSVSKNDHPWHVRADKLAEVKVPPTLTGLLQARLDGLPAPEREALQQASVIGRLFWDEAIADLAQVPADTLAPILSAIHGRGLIFRREQSSFAQVGEYIFKHSLLRDVAYETVLLKRRAEFHGRVARWLEVRAGDRLDEYATLIADHYIQAGERIKAATLLEHSGEEAINVGAYALARQSLERAVALRDQGEAVWQPETVWAMINLGQAAHELGDYPATEAAFARALAGARELGDVAAQAEALAGLAWNDFFRGDYSAAQMRFDEALPLARLIGGRTLARALVWLAGLRFVLGDADGVEANAAESLLLARAIGDVTLELSSLGHLALAAETRGDSAESMRRSEAAFDLARRSGNLSRQTLMLNYLGSNAYESGDAEKARAYYHEALLLGRELGARQSIALSMLNLAQAELLLGDQTAARQHASEGLAMMQALQATPWVLFGVHVFGQLAVAEGDLPRALKLFGLERAHPALGHEGQVEVDRDLARLALPADVLAAGLATGAGLDLDAVVGEILGEA